MLVKNYQAPDEAWEVKNSWQDEMLTCKLIFQYRQRAEKKGSYIKYELCEIKGRGGGKLLNVVIPTILVLWASI